MRKKDYKIGRVHGRVTTKTKKGENEIRNQVFLIGQVMIEEKQGVTLPIRIISYEFPLGSKRDNCIDLMGYDKKHNPWIFELKKENTKDSIEKMVNQVNCYADKFSNIIHLVAEEISRVYFLENFNLTTNIRKVILIPREYYNNRSLKLPNANQGILFCTFARIKPLYDSDGRVNLLNKTIKTGCIRLRVMNKRS